MISNYGHSDFQHTIGLDINCGSDGRVLSSSSSEINVAFMKDIDPKALEINDLTFHAENQWFTSRLFFLRRIRISYKFKITFNYKKPTLLFRV